MRVRSARQRGVRTQGASVRGERRGGASGWLLLSVLLASCTARYPVNAPQPPGTPTGLAAVPVGPEVHRSEGLLVGLAFSGGGTRAAAFSYGVLEVLAEARIHVDGRERRVLDEVDVISSVSGGSFTSAYFGLFGDRIFEDYADKFLHRDVQGHLEWSLLSPLSWFRLGSSRFDRSDMAAQYYDDILFEKKTFGDVVARGGPRLNINATEIALGSQFTFDPAQFSLICSDWAGFPVARAVTASSAVPILFGSVVLKNYAGKCPLVPAPWARAAEAHPNPRVAHLLAQMKAYTQPDELPYLHLFDGGLTDNLGVRPFLNRLTLSGGSWELAKAMGAADTHRMLVIVVNAESEMDIEFRRSPGDLSLGEAIMASTSIPLNEYTLDSLTLLRLALDGLARQIVQGRCAEWAATRSSTEGCDDLEVYLVEVDFDELTDPVQRRKMKRLPTSFHLPAEDVDGLRAAAREIMGESVEFRRFLRDTDGKWAPAGASPEARNR